MYQRCDLCCRRANKLKVQDCETIHFAEYGLKDNVALLVLLRQRERRPGALLALTACGMRL